MRLRLCRICMVHHEVENWPPKCVSIRSSARSSLPAPYFICDTQDPLQSMADGKLYDSKSAMRASYKAENNPHGVDFIEVGNMDTATFNPPKRDRAGDREAIERAINDVQNGNVPPLLTEVPAF